MRDIKPLLALVVIVAALAWWAGTSPDSPIRPEPPKPDRPVLRFVAKVAKMFLWVAMVAERQPGSDEVQLVHARIGSDGHPVLDNGRSW